MNEEDKPVFFVSSALFEPLKRSPSNAINSEKLKFDFMARLSIKGEAFG